jgi:arsenate reductase
MEVGGVGTRSLLPAGGRERSPDPLYLTGMEVQVFGTKKCPDTRKALRFFAERRIKTHFVDLAERAASLGELTRFAQRFGVGALIDSAGKQYAVLGLASARYSDERWLDRLVEEPMLLKTPLVRWQNKLTIGASEETWRTWVEAA